MARRRDAAVRRFRTKRVRDLGADLLLALFVASPQECLVQTVMASGESRLSVGICTCGHGRRLPIQMMLRLSKGLISLLSRMRSFLGCAAYLVLGNEQYA